MVDDGNCGIKRVYVDFFRYFEVIKGSSGLGLALKGGKDENCPILVKNMQRQGTHSYLVWSVLGMKLLRYIRNLSYQSEG